MIRCHRWELSLLGPEKRQRNVDNGDSLNEVGKKVKLHLIYLLEAELVCMVRTNVIWGFGL